MSKKIAAEPIFKTRLVEYKKLIDADIATYSKEVLASSLKLYGANSHVATKAYLDVLSRGGKRIRGALTMVGYEMSGGKDRQMILQVARAIEMIQAYVLIIDDINDRSLTRRSGPSAHAQLAEHYLSHEYGQDSQHFGESIAMNSALLGSHAAQMILANVDVADDLKLKAISILNRGLLVTVHGQFNDIFNEVTGVVTEADVANVTQWKTAHYTFLNPLHIGMILAGADCHETDAITDYAMHTGTAFQIVDDILGTFGGDFETGKSPLDDTREGKRTLLSVYALEHADSSNKNFLVQMLGNHALTPEQFARCKEIFVECGALEYTKKQAAKHANQALKSLDTHSHLWKNDDVLFLRQLVEYLLVRTS